jgi:hypothetical protein
MRKNFCDLLRTLFICLVLFLFLGYFWVFVSFWAILSLKGNLLIIDLGLFNLVLVFISCIMWFILGTIIILDWMS